MKVLIIAITVLLLIPEIKYPMSHHIFIDVRITVACVVITLITLKIAINHSVLL